MAGTAVELSPFARKACWAFLILSVLIALSLSSIIAIKNGAPRATDFYYHLRFAQEYAQGQIAMLDPALMANNNGPYPPLFHLFLTIPTALGLGVGFGAFLEIFIYPLALLAAVFFVFKRSGLKTAAFAAVLLVGAVGLFDRGGQVTPQAVDMIFMPLAAWAFFESKELLFVASIAIMAYSHAPYSFLLLAPFILYAFLKNVNKASVIKAIAVCIPIALVILLYLPMLLGAAGGVNNRQEQLIQQIPLYLVGYIGTPLVVAFVIAAFYWFFKKQKLDSVGDNSKDLGLFSLLWLLCLAPLLVFFPDRFTSYAAQPLAIFSAVVLAGLVTKTETLVESLGALFFLALIYSPYAFFLLFLAGRITPAP